MGTYTTNYNLFMPSIGEQGWGELVNGNFTTIDTAMKGLDTRVVTLEAEMDAVEGRVTVLEAGEFETINVTGTIEGDTVKVNKLSVPYNPNGQVIISSEPQSITKACSSSPTWGNDIIVKLPSSGYPQWIYVDGAECTLTASIYVDGRNTKDYQYIRILDSYGNILATNQSILNGSTLSCSASVSPYGTYTIQGYTTLTLDAFKLTISATGLYLTA